MLKTILIPILLASNTGENVKTSSGAGGFVDTRVTFAVSNTDIGAGPGERIRPTSGFRMGIDRDFQLFLEDIDTRFTGYETLSHLVLYGKAPAFFDRIETEVSLAMLVLANIEKGEYDLFDSGSFLRIAYRFGAGKEEDVHSLDLTAWPVSSDRFRLGYTYFLSWGGTAIFPGKLQSSSITEGAVPGVRLRWRAPKGRAYAFLGVKSARLLSRKVGSNAGEKVPNFGGLAGFGINIKDTVLVEANGGVFQKGTQEAPGLEGEPITAWGASARVTYYLGDKPSDSADFRLYRNDPAAPVNYDIWKPYTHGRGFSIALEGNVLGQNLADPDKSGSEELVLALAAGLVAEAKIDALTLYAYGFYRNLDAVVFNVPGLVAFQATFDAATTTPEIFGAVAMEYAFEAIHLRPRLSLGMKVPATYQGQKSAETGPLSGVTNGEFRNNIILSDTESLPLPPGADPTPVFGVLVTVPYGISRIMAISLDLLYELDDNKPRLAKDRELGQPTTIFDSPHRVGFALSLQGRW